MSFQKTTIKCPVCNFTEEKNIELDDKKLNDSISFPWKCPNCTGRYGQGVSTTMNITIQFAPKEKTASVGPYRPTIKEVTNVREIKDQERVVIVPEKKKKKKEMVHSTKVVVMKDDEP